MKILSVLKSAAVSRAGDGMEAVYARLLDEGHEVHVVAPERGPLTDRLEGLGGRVHLYPELALIDGSQLKTVTGWLKLLGAIVFSVWTLARLIIRLRIDVVHTNTLLTPVAAIAAAVTGRPHMWHARELLHGWASTAYLKWVVRGTEGLKKEVVAVSEATRDQFPRSSRTKVRVIYDGLDWPAWTPQSEQVRTFRRQFDDGVLLVGVVGRIRWHRKGQETAVRAAAMLREKHPEARYVFVGAPKKSEEMEEVRLRELIAVYGLEEIVTIQRDPVWVGEPSLFAALDLLAAPLLQAEPLDRTVIAAMAVGTAVVGSEISGVSELIDHGETGLTFPATDFERLARELDLLLSDQEARKRMAEAAQMVVRERFDLRKTAWELSAELKRMGRRVD